MSQTLSFPIVSEIAESVKRSGEWNKSLNADELRQLMLNVMHSLLKAQSSVHADVNKVDVSLSGCDKKAKIFAAISIFKPISAEANFRFIFGNCSSNKGTVALEDLRVEEFPDNLIARIALGTISLEQKIRNMIATPTQALRNVLSDQLLRHNLKIDDYACVITSGGLFRMCLVGSSL